MRQSHLILLNAAVIWASRVLRMVPRLVMVPFLIRTIGETGYGVYVLIWSLLMAIDQLERSLQSGVVKYSAAFLAEKRIEEVNRVVSSSFIYSILLAILAAAGIFLAAAFFGNPMGNLAIPLFVLSVLVLLTIPLTPYIAIIQSRQRYYVGVLAETFSAYMSLAVVVVWFTRVRPSVEALTVIMTGMLFLSRIVQVPVAYRLVPGLQNRPSLFDWRAFRLIVSFGGATVFAALCGIANHTGVRWLMGFLVSTSFVAHLAIILMPGLLLTQIVGAMTITVMPATSAYQASGNDRMLKELLLRSMRYACILVLAGTIVAILLVENVLSLWVGSKYTFLAPYTLAFFISVAFLMTASSAHHMLKGLGKLRVTIFNSLVGQVLVPFALIVMVFLVWRNPYIAVTAGLAAGNGVWAVMQIGFAFKAVRAEFGKALTYVYLQPLVVGGAVAAPALALTAYGSIESLWWRVAIAGLTGLSFLAGVYFIFASEDERKQAREIGHMVLRRTATLRRKPSRHPVQ